ncbi:MAG: outer membrane beta-barrel protein [Bacteroidetes bacterium]|nr:outer membrane beta-barrel protein [Bacteroidota bacterium]
MRKLFFLLFIVILCSSVSVSAQPKITIHLTGGYGVPLGDFKVDVPNDPNKRLDADDLPYYTKQLVTFGADGKLALGKKGNARVVLGLSYNQFSNNTNGTFRIDTANGGTLGQVNFKPHVNIFSVYLGGEWAFRPNEKINPFVGAGLAGNFFGGDFKFGQSVYTKGAYRTELQMKSETRIGIVFDGGVDFRISDNIGAIAGIKYHLINAIGKGSDDESEIAADEVDLGDKEHVRDDGTNSPSKSLSSFNGYLGVSFYFGAPKTMKKK